MNDYKNIVPEFINESLDSVGRIAVKMPEIIKDLAKGDVSSLKKEKTLFRIIHSISGGSSFLGLENIEKISSWLEKTLFFLENENLPADDFTASLIDDMFFLIKESLENKGKVKKRPLNKIEKQISRLFSEIKGQDRESEIDITLDGKEFSFLIDLDKIGPQLEKKGLYLLNIDPINDLDENKQSLTDFISKLLEFGDILDSIIDIDNVFDDSIPVSVLYLSNLSQDQLKNELIEIPQDKIVFVDSKAAKKLFGFEEEDISKREMLQTEKILDDETYQESFLNQEEDSSPDVEKEEEREFVSFRIGKEYYAVSIKDVFDMKEMLPCSRIPNQPTHMLGVMNLRGNVVPVIDLRLLMGKKNVEYGEFSVFLIVKVKEKITGCVVDAIDDVVFLEPEDTQITPVTSRQINIDYVKFIAKDPKTGLFLIVLDLEKMLINE